MSRALERYRAVMDEIRRTVFPSNKIKSIKLEWKEMGEFAGDAVFPMVTIDFYQQE